MAAFSIWLSAKMVMRFGIRLPIIAGMLLSAAGLGLFALWPKDASFMLHVMPGMLLLGVGCGMALNPVMLAAMQDVAPEQSGLASGVVNTSFMMGGALGLAILASLSERAGYHAAFAVAALCALVAAAAAAWLPRAAHSEKEVQYAH
jgi:predicted MFS family arabinose efflux permease